MQFHEFLIHLVMNSVIRNWHHSRMGKYSKDSVSNIIDIAGVYPAYRVNECNQKNVQ